MGHGTAHARIYIRYDTYIGACTMRHYRRAQFAHRRVERIACELPGHVQMYYTYATECRMLNMHM